MIIRIHKGEMWILFKKDTNINNADILLNIINVNCKKAAEMREDICKLKKVLLEKIKWLLKRLLEKMIFFEEDYVVEEIKKCQ